MKQSIMKKFGLLMLSVCLIACMFGAFITLKPTNVNADTDFVMDYGASVRMNAEKYGIKYRAILSSVKDDVTYSMLIIPDDYRTTYNLTEGSDYIDLLDDSNVEYVTMNCKPFVEKDVTYIQGSLTSIKYKNIDRDFFGIAYYTDANGLRTYATFTEGDTTRNIVEVASKAMNDGEADPNGVLPILIKQGVNKANGVAEENKNDDIASFAGSTEEIVVGDNTVLDIGVPAGCDIEVKWSSANKDVATVDENGKVTAVACGTTIITANALGQNYTFTNVKVPVDATVNGETVTFLNGKANAEWTATINGEKAKVYGNSINVYDYVAENATLVAGENNVVVKLENTDGASYETTVPVFGLTQSNFGTAIYNSANCTPQNTIKDDTYYVLTENVYLNSAYSGTIDGTWIPTRGQMTNYANTENKKVNQSYNNQVHLFGVFTATLNGNGYNITLDMQDEIGGASAFPANEFTVSGMFVSVYGTIKNLSYNYYVNESAVGASTAGTGYFCQFLQHNANYGTGTIENCYMKAIVGDAIPVYNGFVAHHHAGSVVKNNVFDYKVIDADGNVVNEGGAIGVKNATATVNNNIIISNSAYQTDEEGSVAYASYADAINATNMLDSVSAWGVSDGNITLCGKAINNPTAIDITVENTTASVSSWMATGWNVYRYNTETNAYDLLTTVNGNDASVDVIAVLESKGLIKAGENTYSEKIKFISLDGALCAEDTVEFTVTGLNNENFVSLMRTATVNASTASFVLIEDIALDMGVIGTKDGTKLYTEADWKANLAKQHTDGDVKAWNVFYAFGRFSGTLNGLGYKVDLDLTGEVTFVANVWKKLGGLFSELAGTVENINYTYKANKLITISASTESYGFFVGAVNTTGVIRNCSLKAELNLNGFTDAGDFTGMIAEVQGSGRVTDSIIDFTVLDAESNPVTNAHYAIGKKAAASTVANVVWINNGNQTFSKSITSGYTEYASYDAAISADNMLDDSSVWAIDDAGNLTLCGRAVYTVNA